MWLRFKTNGSHFGGVGEFTAHFRTCFSGDWDVHWGYDFDFDPWPCVETYRHPRSNHWFLGILESATAALDITGKFEGGGCWVGGFVLCLRRYPCLVVLKRKTNKKTDAFLLGGVPFKRPRVLLKEFGTPQHPGPKRYCFLDSWTWETADFAENSNLNKKTHA